MHLIMRHLLQSPWYYGGALTGPMTPPGKRVQTINPPGSEVGLGAVATWAKSTADQADAMGFKWERKGQSSKHIPFEWSGP
jgi:hypothetical protein